MTLDIKAIAKQAGGLPYAGIPETVWFDMTELAEFVRLVRAVPAGFNLDDLSVVADALDCYEKTVNVGASLGPEYGDVLVESTTAYAARFIRAMLEAAKGEAK